MFCVLKTLVSIMQCLDNVTSQKTFIDSVTSVWVSPWWFKSIISLWCSYFRQFQLSRNSMNVATCLFYNLPFSYICLWHTFPIIPHIELHWMKPERERERKITVYIFSYWNSMTSTEILLLNWNRTIKSLHASIEKWRKWWWWQGVTCTLLVTMTKIPADPISGTACSWNWHEYDIPRTNVPLTWFSGRFIVAWLALWNTDITYFCQLSRREQCERKQSVLLKDILCCQELNSWP